MVRPDVRIGQAGGRQQRPGANSVQHPDVRQPVHHTRADQDLVEGVPEVRCVSAARGVVVGPGRPVVALAEEPPHRVVEVVPPASVDHTAAGAGDGPSRHAVQGVGADHAGLERVHVEVAVDDGPVVTGPRLDVADEVGQVAADAQPLVVPAGVQLALEVDHDEEDVRANAGQPTDGDVVVGVVLDVGEGCRRRLDENSEIALHSRRTGRERKSGKAGSRQSFYQERRFEGAFSQHEKADVVLGAKRGDDCHTVRPAKIPE